LTRLLSPHAGRVGGGAMRCGARDASPRLASVLARIKE
jgi:hypothetical protein